MNTKPGHESERTNPSRERVRRPRRGLLGQGPEMLEGRQLLSTDVWTGANNNFNDPANWSTGAVPVSGDTIAFDGQGTAQATALPDSFTPGAIDVESDFTFTGTLNVAGTVPVSVKSGATLNLLGTKLQGTGSLVKVGDGTLAVNTANAANSSGITFNGQQGEITLGASGSIYSTFAIGSGAKLTETVGVDSKPVSVNGFTVTGAPDGTAGAIKITSGNTFAPAAINNGFFTIEQGAVLSPSQINGGYFTQQGPNIIATDQALNGQFTMKAGGTAVVKASNFGSSFGDGGTTTPNDFTVNVVPDDGTSAIFGSTVSGGGKFVTSGKGNVILSNGIHESTGALEATTLTNSGDVVLASSQTTLATPIDIPNAPTFTLAQWSTLNLANSSLTIDKAAVALNQNTSLNLNVGGLSAGTQYGQLVSGGGIALNNATLNINPTIAPPAGTVFTILKATGSSTITGQFASLGQGTVFTQGGITFQINYTSQAVTVTSRAQTTTTTISTPNGTIKPGDNVSLVAKVAGAVGTPTGTVTFSDGTSPLGSAPLVNGVATLSGLGFAGGNHKITASYSGDPAFTASTSAALSQSVRPSNSTLVLYGTANSAPVGQAVLLIATATSNAGTPTGAVTFFDGTTNLGTATLDGNGHAVLPVTNLPIGAHSITASYAGDANNTSTTTAKAQALAITAVPTNVVVAASPNPGVYGQTTTITAAVVPTVATNQGTPTGVVQFFDGKTAIGTAGVDATGHANLTTSTLTVGKNSITATYQGDSKFATATNVAASPVTVVAAQTTTSLTVSPNPPIVGRPMLFTATVASTTSGTPTGTVTFKNGGKVLGKIALTGGQAFLVTTLNFTASQSITATYSGSTSYTDSTSTSVSLTPPTTTAPPPTVVPATPKPATPSTPTTPTTPSSPSVSNPVPVTIVRGHKVAHPKPVKIAHPKPVKVAHPKPAKVVHPKVAHPKPVKIVLHHPAAKKHK